MVIAGVFFAPYLKYSTYQIMACTVKNDGQLELDQRATPNATLMSFLFLFSHYLLFMHVINPHSYPHQSFTADTSAICITVLEYCLWKWLRGKCFCFRCSIARQLSLFYRVRKYNHRQAVCVSYFLCCIFFGFFWGGGLLRSWQYCDDTYLVNVSIWCILCAWCTTTYVVSRWK